MASIENNTEDGFIKRLFRYFIQGLIILAPIAITVYVLYLFFNWVDNFLRPFIGIPGLGFVIIIVFILFIGWISSSILMEAVLGFLDHWLERTPGIKILYTSAKDFFQAFAGDRKKFTQPVLANIFGSDVWVLGFVTDEAMEKFHLGTDTLGVYVPHSYAFSGQLYILPRAKVKLINNISAGDAMKYTVTGGVVEMETKHPETKKS